MLSTQTLKQILLTEIDKLPAQDLQEILNFAHYLQFRRKYVQPPDFETPLSPRDDPILELMGIGDVEPLAQDIDELSYNAV